MKEKLSENLKTGLLAAIVGGFAVAFAFYANEFCTATGLSGDGWGLTLAILLSAAAFCVGAIWLSVSSFRAYVREKRNGKESVIGLLCGLLGVVAGGVSAFVNGVNIALLFVF